MTKTRITVCIAERTEPFVCAAYGAISGENISEIESDLAEYDDGFWVDRFSDLVMTVECFVQKTQCDYSEGGTGDGWWEFQAIGMGLLVLNKPIVRAKKSKAKGD